MGFFDFIVSISLLGFGAILGAYLIWVLFRGLSENLSFIPKPSFGTGNKLKKADKYIEKDQYQKALKELKKSFVFSETTSKESVKKNRNHNEAILNRCLIISEHMHSSLEGLPEVEKLLIERSQLQLQFIKAIDSLDLLKAKRRSEGKKLPEWGQKEHKEKIKELKEALKNNKNMLEKAINALFVSMSSPRQTNVTYH